MEALEAAHREVATVLGDRQVADDGKAPGLDDLDLGVQRQGGGERVKARPEVRRGRGHADKATTLHARRTLSAAPRPVALGPASPGVR